MTRSFDKEVHFGFYRFRTNWAEPQIFRDFLNRHVSIVSDWLRSLNLQNGGYGVLLMDLSLTIDNINNDLLLVKLRMILNMTTQKLGKSN